jgi:hypothetical protein
MTVGAGLGFMSFNLGRNELSSILSGRLGTIGKSTLSMRPALGTMR